MPTPGQPCSLPDTLRNQRSHLVWLCRPGQCTNPAAPGSGNGLLDPIFPSQPFDPGSTLAAGLALVGVPQPRPATVWSSEPGSYQARCSSADDANVLEITAVGVAVTPMPSPTPAWGLHLLDANIALGNLVAIVAKQAKAFTLRARGSFAQAPPEACRSSGCKPSAPDWSPKCQTRCTS
ncbi:MAG: hypothetical protein ABSG43_02100 [Solirubrobacteraceae bacterium]